MTAAEQLGRIGFDALLRDAGVWFEVNGARVRGLVRYQFSHFAPLDTERQTAQVMFRADDFPNGLPFTAQMLDESKQLTHRIRNVDRGDFVLVVETEIFGREFAGPMVG